MRRRIQPGEQQAASSSIASSKPVGEERPISPTARLAGEDKPEPPIPAEVVIPAVDEAIDQIGSQDEQRLPPPAPPPAGELVLGMGVERIVNSVFAMPDSWLEYQELRASLRSKERASSMSAGRLMDELDQAADRAQRGAELLAVVKASHDDFDMLAEISMSAMRDQATEQLLGDKNKRKAAKEADKRLTEADIAAAIANMYLDEVTDLKRRRSKSKRGVSVVESLAERLQERERDLRAMVANRRGE